MKRSLFALTTVLVVATAGPVRSQPAFTKSGSATFNSITAQTIGSGATVNGTPLATVVSQAGAALPTAALPSTTFRGNLDDIARTLADRMSDRLNVKAFGAKGDGVTDDTQAFQNAAAVATGHIPTGIGAPLSAYLGGLANFLGIGAKINGAVEIDIPAGHYVLSAPIAVNYQPNSAIHWKGDGSSMTELEFRGGIDGLVTTYNPNGPANNNDGARTGLWTGQGIVVEGIHFVANTGLVKPVYSASGVLGTNIGTGQGESGTAIRTIGYQLVGASIPPFQVYNDLLFTNSGGWNDAANNWKGALYLQDADNTYINRVSFVDHSLDYNRTSIPIWLHSTSPATISNIVPGHGNINLDYVLVLGGVTGIQIDGNDFQGINIMHGTTTGVQDGITWLAGQDTLSGSLTITEGSFGAARYVVHATNVATIFSHDNFYYNVAPPKSTDPIYFYATNGSQVMSHNDQFAGPVPGYEGTGHSSTAIYLSGYPALVTAPSSISNDTIANFDTGMVFAGGVSMNFTNDVVSNATTTCYKDIGTGTSGMRAQFDGIYCSPGVVNTHDGIGLNLQYDWVPGRFMNGGIELGLPGVTSPGGVTGYGGNIDFHYAASTNGAISGLNDYDVRLITHGGVAGTNGQGTLDLYGAGGLNLVSGPLTGSSFKMTGTGSMAAGTVTGNLAVGQYLTVGSVTMSALATGCSAGSLVYVSDGRKTGEAAGAGSGVPAVCLPTSKGGASGWYALQPSALSN